MISYRMVPKAVAKKMIDECPCEMVPIAVYDMDTHVHRPTERKSKKSTKELIEIAKEVGLQENDIFNVLGCRMLGNEIQSIFLPRLLE